jgi:hypothetical protein
MNNIRPEWTPTPTQAVSSKGSVANVGADSGSQINPENEGSPASPVSSKGAVPATPGTEKPLIRHEMPK